MIDWAIQDMARQHRKQLLEEAQRERLAHAASLPQSLHRLSRWWEALAINWKPSEAVRADQLGVTCESCGKPPICGERKVSASGQAI